MRGPIISAWATVSPFGLGKEAFREGLRSARRTAAPLPEPGPDTPAPDRFACLVPDFSAQEVLGKKGTRSMDRVTALTAAAVGQLVEAARTPEGDRPGPGTALVLGTTTGSAQSMMDFTRSSLTGEKPFFVDPARFPNTVMNCAAGQSAIRHGLKGPNATIGGGRTAGLLALNYARRLQRTGRAHTVLCGGAEEYSTARGWLQLHSREADENEAVLGEGCAVLLLEPDTAAQTSPDALAQVVALEFGVFADPADIQQVLASCLRRALADAGAAPADVHLVAPCDAPGLAGRQERAAIAEVITGTGFQWVSCSELIGDTSAGAASFQLAAVLALTEGLPAATGRLALVTAVDRSGSVGCALLRIMNSASRKGH